MKYFCQIELEINSALAPASLALSVSALRIPIDELRTVKIVNKSEARVALSAADCLFKVSAKDFAQRYHSSSAGAP